MFISDDSLMLVPKPLINEKDALIPVYLTPRANDTLKVQTDYLTFGNLITTSP